jgi:hypothetical protein
MRAFVGRERELPELRSGFDAVLWGSGRLFLISAEPATQIDSFASHRRIQRASSMLARQNL